ncbi:ABC transporter ATP-binding protein [Aquipuribacter hungaricus]|uniref:ABC transporter ATP-binding protein n=1 Tax=Aquipuribacter hungaricus TaxID=545624 RepID=A0ABV7WEI7_9MICO
MDASGPAAVPPTLSLSGLSYAFGRRPVLTGLDGQSRGRVVAVLGENGAGKSTLLRMLATVTRPTGGWFCCAGWDSRDRQGVAGYRSRLGVVPQHLDLASGYTCEDVLRYVCWLKRVPAADVPGAVERVLAALELRPQRGTRVGRLSGGTRQRLNLAQALVNDPQLVILDEPTVGLDPRQRVELRRHLSRAAQHATLIMATHLVEDVAALADDVVVLSGGRITYWGDLPTFCTGHGIAVAGDTVTGTELEKAFLHLLDTNADVDASVRGRRDGGAGA